MTEFLAKALIFFIILGLVLVYFWFRFGPKKCPKCKTRVWGIPGPHIGIRKMYFECKKCGNKFEGHRRFPL